MTCHMLGGSNDPAGTRAEPQVHARSVRRSLRRMIAMLALVAPLPAMADCKVSKVLELPVTMAGSRPMVPAKFGDKEARFILDSGAFYSTISAASATQFGLWVEPAPFNFRLRGINGDASAQVGTAKDFSLAGVAIPRVDFVVGGTDTGTAGLLGQNILGLADVEYDLPHGAVRLMKTSGCGRVSLAYWAGTKPVTMLALERPESGPFNPHTVGTILLNGVKIRAIFDSGAQTSVLTLAAAKRAGITPASPGVVSAGFGSGLGSRRLQAWTATFDKIDIGGESIPHPKIRIADIDLPAGDMLVGIDFFLTHRIFVSNADRTMSITYEGGPVFGLSPRGARSSDGKALDLTDEAPAPVTAEDYSRRGAVLASNHRLRDALADFDRAAALAPNESRYVYQRAMAHFAMGDAAAGRFDLDRTLTLAPADTDAHLRRAAIRLRADDTAGAGEDLAAADRALAPSSAQRLEIAGLYDMLGAPEQAAANYELWLKSHPEDAARPRAFNGHCWALGQLGRDLDRALSDCNAAVRGQPGTAAYLDSRGLVRMRRGEMRQALADYDAALQIAPGNAWSRYMRGLVKRRMGDMAGANEDQVDALKIDRKVADRARRIGVDAAPPTPPSG